MCFFLPAFDNTIAIVSKRLIVFTATVSGFVCGVCSVRISENKKLTKNKVSTLILRRLFLLEIQ